MSVTHVEMSPEAIAEKKPYLALGLTEDEYHRFVELIGHQPNDTEIGLASGSGVNTVRINTVSRFCASSGPKMTAF